MSRKVVPFGMPGKKAARRGEARPRDLSVPKPKTPEAKPRSRRGASARGDDWVQHREASTIVAPSNATEADTGMRSWSIDLSAERDAMQVMALALLVPPMLGWFWLFNLASRYWSALTGRTMG